MARHEEKKPKAEDLKEEKERVDRQYICPGKSSIFFYIPIRDQSGKMVPEKDVRGNQKFNGDQPMWKMKLEKFETIFIKQSITAEMIDKSMCGYLLKADDPLYDDKLAALEKLRLDPSNMVMGTEMYDKWRNPEASQALIDNKKLREENAQKDDIIAKQAKESAELRRLLEEATGGK